MSFSIKGIRIVLSYPLAAAMTAAALVDNSQSVVLCFIAAILHECGHLFVMGHYGIRPRELKMSLFDIAIIAPQKQLCTPRQGIIIDLAGVTVNAICAIILLAVYFLLPQTWILTAATSHIMLFVFNSLPIMSLDGGHALTLMLSVHCGEEKAEKIVTVISIVLLVPLSVLGFLWLLQSKYNFTLLLSGLYLIVLLLKKCNSKHNACLPSKRVHRLISKTNRSGK